MIKVHAIFTQKGSKLHAIDALLFYLPHGEKNHEEE